MNLLKVLANDTRMRMVKLLNDCGQMTHAEMIRALDPGVVTLHYHLQLLREAGLIEKEEVDCREVYYTLVPHMLDSGLRDILYAEEVEVEHA